MAGLKSLLGEGLEAGIKNIKKVGGGGEYLEAAVTGALAMGAVGGVTEWSQGGSFWSGAKGNLVSGAALGMGVRATNIGINGSNWDKATMSSTYDKVRGKAPIGTAPATATARKNVSKPLGVLQDHQKRTQVNQKMLSGGPQLLLSYSGSPHPDLSNLYNSGRGAIAL